ncbi:MAG TPA: DNA repair protein RadC [Candidatus Omnitrophota bacterium]|nr:DNA repair protein RadC [Candidatus Omnitrophota bacterium]
MNRSQIRDKKFCGIHTWAESERPRERILLGGGQNLTDAELIALLLRSGTSGKDAISLSRELLAQFGGLRGLFSANQRELIRVKGLGPAKTSVFLAVKEISLRRLREELLSKVYVRDPRSVLDFFYASLRDQKREMFKVLFLDKGNRIVGEKTLFEGTVDETAVHPREVVRAALEMHATNLILVHNHPSGRTQPSGEDIEITKTLTEACRIIGVRVLDHIVIGDNQYFSFSEHSML